MFLSNEFCCICFDQKNLVSLSDAKNNEISHYDKLITSVPEMCFENINKERKICKNCMHYIESCYNFRQNCLKTKMLYNYLSKLNFAGQMENEQRIIQYCSNVIRNYKIETTVESNNYVDLIDDEDIRQEDYITITNINVYQEAVHTDTEETFTNIQEQSIIPLQKENQICNQHQYNESNISDDSMINNSILLMPDITYEIVEGAENITLTLSSRGRKGVSKDARGGATNERKPVNKKTVETQSLMLGDRAVRGYTCYVCMEKFSSLYYLLIHKKKHELFRSTKKYQTDIEEFRTKELQIPPNFFSKYIPNESEIKLHEKIVLVLKKYNENSYECSFKGSDIDKKKKRIVEKSTENDDNTHKKILMCIKRLGETSYECSVQGQKEENNNNSMNNLQKQKKNKKYIVHDYNFRHKRKSNYEDCYNKRFKTDNINKCLDYNANEKAKSKNKVFTCKLCRKAFVVLSDVWDHIQNHHFLYNYVYKNLTLQHSITG